MIRRALYLAAAFGAGLFFGRRVTHVVFEGPEEGSSTVVDQEAIADYGCPHCGAPVTVSVGYSKGRRSQIAASWSCGHDLVVAAQIVCMEQHG